MYKKLLFSICAVGIMHAGEFKQGADEKTSLVRSYSKFYSPYRDDLEIERTVELKKDLGKGRIAERYEVTRVICKRCNSEFRSGVCGCSKPELPQVDENLLALTALSEEVSVPIGSPLAVRHSAVNHVFKFDLPKPKPNRFCQALAATVVCPQTLATVCCTSDLDDDCRINNGCYNAYIAPFELAQEYENNECCFCMFTFFPCCVPQEADSWGDTFNEHSTSQMYE